jgi:hypothetical protein
VSYYGQHLGVDCEDTICLIPDVAWQIDFGEQRWREHHDWLPWWPRDTA